MRRRSGMAELRANIEERSRNAAVVNILAEAKNIFFLFLPLKAKQIRRNDFVHEQKWGQGNVRQKLAT